MVVVVKTPPLLRKRARTLGFEGGEWWWWWRQPPASKTSVYARFRRRGMVVDVIGGCWMVVVVMAKHHPRKRAYVLVFEGGWWRWLPRHVRRERQKNKTRAHLAPAPAAAAIVVVVAPAAAGGVAVAVVIRSPAAAGVVVVAIVIRGRLQLQVVSPSLSIRTCSRRCRRRCHLLAPTWWWWWERSWRGVKFEFGTSTYMWRVQSHDSTPEFGLREFSKWFDFFFMLQFCIVKNYLLWWKSFNNFFPTLIGVKIVWKFTPIKVVIYSSIFHCKKLPFVVESNSTMKGWFLHYTLNHCFFHITTLKVNFSHPLGLTVKVFKLQMSELPENRA